MGQRITKRKVALLIETSTIYGRQILEGIAKYLKTHVPWSVYLDERELRAAPPAWFLERHWDGILCRITTRELAQAFRAKKIPAVDLNDIYGDLGLHRIRSNMHAIGRMGAIHLFERGFRHFAFCGFARETWSLERREGFVAEVEERGYTCSVYESVWRGKGEPKWDTDQQRIAKWLNGLPKPLGVMACNDVRGHHVLNACQMSGSYVPETVAVVGVDNDELLCNFCNPPLSSIQPNPQRIGYEAAKVLDQLMDGQRVNSHEQLIEPIGVTTRQSTDALGIDDPEIVAAVKFIRESACSGLKVDDITRHLSVSRSFLERRFRSLLGHSPQQEIRRTQIKQIKELLRETDLALGSIARLTGFEHTEYMTVVFKRMTGVAPSEFRTNVKDF